MSEAPTSQAITVDSILPKIAHLQQMLETAAPGIENYLMEINEDLRQYPELTFMLSDEQIAPIYSAIMKREGIALAVKASKKKGSKRELLPDGGTVADIL